MRAGGFHRDFLVPDGHDEEAPPPPPPQPQPQPQPQPTVTDRRRRVPKTKATLTTKTLLGDDSAPGARVSVSTLSQLEASDFYEDPYDEVKWDTKELPPAEREKFDNALQRVMVAVPNRRFVQAGADAAVAAGPPVVGPRHEWRFEERLRTCAAQLAAFDANADPFCMWPATLARERELLEALPCYVNTESEIASLRVRLAECGRNMPLQSALADWCFDERLAPLKLMRTEPDGLTRFYASSEQGGVLVAVRVRAAAGSHPPAVWHTYIPPQGL